MVRSAIPIVFIAAGFAQAQAPRFDGCTRAEPKESSVTLTDLLVPPADALDRDLQQSGYSSTRESAISALQDPRPDVRSVAALKIGSRAQKYGLAKLLAARLTEHDDCAKSEMSLSLSQTLWGLHSPPGGLPRFPPFQPCTPSEPAMISLTIKPERRYGPNKVQVVARNLTSQTLPFLGTRVPEELFSVTVMDPTDKPATVPTDQEYLYRPSEPPNARNGFHLMTTNGPIFGALPPNEDVPLWTWDIGSDFDLPAPGIYRISLGGAIDFLNTTICSNTFDLEAGPSSQK